MTRDHYTVTVPMGQAALWEGARPLLGYLDMELKAITSRFSALLEPFLIALVGIVVGSMVLSVFLPIFKLHGTLV